MDRYFYSVELDEERKVIHLFGNVYCNGDGQTEKDYRFAEWTFLYIPIDFLKELMKYDQFYDYANEKVAYLGNLTEAEAIEICERYFNGKTGTYLHITDVNEEIPCGDYWFDSEV